MRIARTVIALLGVPLSMTVARAQNAVVPPIRTVASLVAAATLVNTSALPRGVPLPFRGDSMMVLDVASSQILIVDSAGSVGRRVTVPLRPFAVLRDATTPGARPITDGAGRLLYRGPVNPVSPNSLDNFRGDTIVAGPDSLPLLRFDPATTKLDTAVMLQAPRTRRVLTRYAGGGQARPLREPIAIGGDDYALMSDGTIAIVRVRDYHVDWLRPDRSMKSGPAVAHVSDRLTLAMKQAIVDSMRVALGPHPDSTFAMDSTRWDSLAQVAAANPDALVGPDGKRILLGVRPARRVIGRAEDLPDARAPFLSGFAVADQQDNIWVAAALSSQPNDGQVYDVIDDRGALVDRVQMPSGVTIVGFTGDLAILEAHVGGSLRIAKARIH